jgi:hypothetical protein
MYSVHCSCTIWREAYQLETCIQHSSMQRELMSLEELYRTCTVDGAAYELDLTYIGATCIQHSSMQRELMVLEELYCNVQCTGQHTMQLHLYAISTAAGIAASIDN